MEETTAGGANTSAAAAVVNEFPPPPIYYKDFSNENLHLIPGPPIPPSTIETYGGMISPPFLITENEQDKQQQALPSHLLPNQLKE